LLQPAVASEAVASEAAMAVVPRRHITHTLVNIVAGMHQSLTRLEVSYIGTPLEPPTLNDLLGSLPTLQHLCLHFSAAGSSDQDWNISLRVRPVDFPESLLRYVPTVEYHGIQCGGMTFCGPCGITSSSGCRSTICKQGNCMFECCRCTRLTSLDLSMLDPHSLDSMFTVGGLLEGITALQRLQHLRLGNCVTQPLAHGVSQMTHLTSLDLLQDRPDGYEFDLEGPQVRCIRVVV
jgi:hypothetical protein